MYACIETAQISNMYSFYIVTLKNENNKKHLGLFSAANMFGKGKMSMKKNKHSTQ
jgi:hypothetical protein